MSSLDLHLCHLKSGAPGINETPTLSFEKFEMVIVDTKRQMNSRSLCIESDGGSHKR